MVELVDAVAVLGRFPALAGASLQVERGEIVLLRGPNGAGKTTLLRLCAGLLPLERGTGRVLGYDLADRPPVGARPGRPARPHERACTPTSPCARTSASGAPRSARHAEEVAASMHRLDLDGRLAGVKVAKLSAGQKRRTALACLVARRAELWLLDEPHAGLDAAGRDELDATLRAAVAAGATVIVASHELERAGNLATRVVDVAGGLASQQRAQT